MATTAVRADDMRTMNLNRRLPATDGAVPAGTTMQQQAPGPITDPNMLASTITPENTLRTQRLGFGVTPTSVTAADTEGRVSDLFAAQLPALQEQFREDQEALLARGAAMGRSGSGLLARDVGRLGVAAQAAREALLGNLTREAVQADAQRQLQADLANQGVTTNVDLARQAHLGNLQAREDMLAREAMADRLTQAQLLSQGFSGAPTGAVGNAANTALAAGGRFGTNAGIINEQLQALMAAQGAVSPAVAQAGAGRRVQDPDARGLA